MERSKNYRAIFVRDLELRLNKFLDCFKQKIIQKDRETLAKRFYDLI